MLWRWETGGADMHQTLGGPVINRLSHSSKSSFLCPALWYWSESEVKSLSCVRLFATPWTLAYQAPPSMGFSRQECWSGLPFPSPGDLPDPGIKPRSPTLQADSLPSEPRGKLQRIHLPMQEVREMQISSLGQEDPLVEEMATLSSILAWKVPWTEQTGGLWSVGLQRVRHNWSNLAHMHAKWLWSDYHNGVNEHIHHLPESPFLYVCSENT